MVKLLNHRTYIVGGAFAALFELTWWPWVFFSFAVLVILVGLSGLLVPFVHHDCARLKT